MLNQFLHRKNTLRNNYSTPVDKKEQLHIRLNKPPTCGGVSRATHPRNSRQESDSAKRPKKDTHILSLHWERDIEDDSAQKDRPFSADDSLVKMGQRCVVKKLPPTFFFAAALLSRDRKRAIKCCTAAGVGGGRARRQPYLPLHSVTLLDYMGGVHTVYGWRFTKFNCNYLKVLVLALYLFHLTLKKDMVIILFTFD